MILTKLFYPKYYKAYRIPSTDEMDFEAMKKHGYTEEAIAWFEKNNFGYGFNEELDTTINRWLKENDGKIRLVDIKYQGYTDDNCNMSALVIYRDGSWDD